MGIPVIEGANVFGDFLGPVFEPAQEILYGGHAHGGGHHSLSVELVLIATSLGIAIIGLLIAYYMYIKDPKVPDQVIEEFPGFHKAIYNKYWVDEIYDFLFVNSIVDFSRWLWKRFDELIVDGAVNGVAWLVDVIGSALRRLQTGLVKDYALSILVGSLFVIGYLVLR